MFDHPALKLYIGDLCSCSKTSEDTWTLELDVRKMSKSRTTPVTVKFVWVQGVVEEVAGKDNETIIISDTTGRVQVIQCNTVPGGSRWLAKGMYCSVIGALISVSGLPEVAAIKVTDLSKNPVLSSLWKEEVRELKFLLTEQAMPKIAEHRD